MPNLKPPTLYTGTPATTVLPAGTILFRIHRKAYPADSFNPGPCDRYYGGGRFDGTLDDPYSFLYAGETVANAIAETLLRDLPFDDVGERLLARGYLKGRRLSALRINDDLVVVDLRTGPALGQVSQDTWLTTADPISYAQTRHWGHWIRTHAPDASGYVWFSRREPATSAYILFGDNTPALSVVDDPAAASLPSVAQRDLDTPQGRRFVRHHLQNYRVSITR